MTQENRPTPSFFTQLDISPGSQNDDASSSAGSGDENETTRLLQDILAGQDRQNELLEELVSLLTANQRQRASELRNWKQAHPQLTRQCRQAAEALSRVQSTFLYKLTEEIVDEAEGLMDGEFVLNEFVDRYGPRLAHLNGVLQILSQLGGSEESST